MSLCDNQKNWNQLASLYNHLVSLGHYYSLSLLADPSQVGQELERYSDDWKIYNPAKSGFKRWGLSLTSLDGGLDGEKDLTSLRELNLKHGTNYGELSFRTLTPVYEFCPSIRPLVEPFAPYLGRSHFLRFEEGGFFPYHRDSYNIGGDTFRIFVPLYKHSSRDFVFFLGDQRLPLETGRAYFINTRMEHALFSFHSRSIHLVLNVELTAESVAAVCRNLHST